MGDVLGRSLMSEVRRGEDVVLRRPVAIKLLRDLGDPRAVARFEQEAQILARLQHPDVVTVFDSGVDHDERFIVMELVEGPTLRELLDAEGRLLPERAAEIAGRLASALGFAHEHGVIHRDVKPSNVLLPAGGVKLADMGIARLLSPEALTATMSVRGTAGYLSPEQARGDAIDRRTDLYSLGCVLFEMLAGRTPFEGDIAALSYAHANTPAPRLRSIDPSIAEPFDELVAGLLEKDPADRPQTGDEVQSRLEAAARQIGVAQTVPMATLPPEPTRRLPVAEGVRPARRISPAIDIGLAGLLGVLVLVLIALLIAKGRDSDPNAAPPSTGGQGQPTTAQPSPQAAGSSPQEAAAIVVETVNQGIQAGEISSDIGEEIRHGIDEILGELDEDSVEKVDELRGKVSEAFQEGEITTDRARAIDDALARFEEALGAGQ
ncbi:MAG TPA: protein kinase [Actinomycetota bacterium]|nr:protein kinase [Actinomycetota bacterium]